MTTWSPPVPPPLTTPLPAQAVNWGFDLADDATVEDFWAAIVAKYGYDISDDGINAETAGTSISSFLEAELGDAYTDYTVAVQTRRVRLPTLPVSSRPVTTP